MHCAVIQYYSVLIYHMNRAGYLSNSSFQYNTVLDKNGDYNDPDDVEKIFERLEELNFNLVHCQQIWD